MGDWSTIDFVIWCGVWALASSGAYLRRQQLSKKRESFYGMDVAIDPTIDMINWVITMRVLAWTYELGACAVFIGLSVWAWKVVFG